MADIDAAGFPWNGPTGISNQLAAFIEEGEEGQAGTFGAQLGSKLRAAGRIEAGLVTVLLHVDSGDHEMLGKDGLDSGSLDKPIETLAPPSPGGPEQQEDVSVLRGGLRFGTRQHLLSGRSAFRRHPHSANDHCQYGCP